ncbi:MAG: hypothetical protein ACP5E8_02550 [Thermoplasmata archaeon]
MKKENKSQSLLLILVEGVALYFILTYIIIGPLLKTYYTAEPAVNEVPFIASYISLGFSVAYVTIVMTIYPTIKFAYRGETDE